MTNLITNKPLQALTSQVAVKVYMQNYFGMTWKLGDKYVKERRKEEKANTDTNMKSRKNKQTNQYTA